MYYSSIGIIALLIHFIVNFGVLRTNTDTDKNNSHYTYKIFLHGVMAFYILDALWGILYINKLKLLVFIDTELYFLSMAAAVFLWTRYVIAYLNDNSLWIKIVFYVGRIFLIFEIVVLILNIFWPIVFWLDNENNYHATYGRFINLFIQLFLFFLTTVHMFIKALQIKEHKRYRHIAIGTFGLAMTFFIILQTLFQLMPFYTIGYLIGTCLINTFVLEDEKNEQNIKMRNLVKLELKQEAELHSIMQIAYKDPLTGVNNKHAYMEAEANINKKIQTGFLKSFGLIVFDLNGLKNINDTKGHDAGDQYIKDACKIICSLFKHSPIYRIGGDEFAAILEGEDYENHNSLIKTFEKIMEENLSTGNVLISDGYDEFDSEKEDSLHSVFERADKKMYERKKLLKELQK